MKRKFAILGMVAVIVFNAFYLPVKATSGQWSYNGSNIYYNDGKLGLGTSTPTDPLQINSTSPGMNWFSSQGVAMIGDSTGSWWISGGVAGPNSGTENGKGYNNIATNAYYYNGWSRRSLNYESWIVSNYVTNNNKGYFSISYAAGQNQSAISNLTKMLEIYADGTTFVQKLVVEGIAWWPDSVFDPSYKQMSIPDLEKYINQNKHLPGVPSEAEVKKNGISVGDMSAIEMQKIEEQSKYIIELKHENDDLKNKYDDLEKRLEKLESEVK